MLRRVLRTQLRSGLDRDCSESCIVGLFRYLHHYAIPQRGIVH
jgi:hypothetical protein